MADILYGVKLLVLEELDEQTQLPKTGGVTCYATTGKSAELEPVVSEGEEKIARSDTKILAIVRTPDLLYGYDIKLVDNTFDVNAAALIEGGAVRKGTDGAIVGYDSAMLAQGATMKPFRATIYVANYQGDAIVNYVKLTLNKCTGKAPTIKVGDEFFAPEFDIKAREATKANLPVKSIDYVDALPTIPATPAPSEPEDDSGSDT